MGKRMIGVIGLAVVLGAMSAGRGQPATVPAAGELKIGLMDGSLVTGKVSVSELTIETKFGVLKVPVDQILLLQPGLKSHPELQQKVADLVADLGADAFGDREKAQEAIVKMGPEIKGELEKQVRGADGEKLTRLQKIIEDFDAQQGDEEMAARVWVPDDVIVTPGFTVVGRITTPGFSVTSSYGKLDLKLSDVRAAHRDAAEAQEVRKTVTVAGNLIQTHQYAASGIKLNKGDQVTITATGTITLTPWGNNAVSTPDGAPNYGTMQPGNIPNGALIAKIGDGTPMKLGSKLTFTADKSGTFQLGLAMGQNFNGNEFPGEYTVKIQVVKKP